MYGAGPQRSKSQTEIQAAAAVPGRLVTWGRVLIEFPAVVADGIAYIGERPRHVRALDMRNGTVALAARHAARQDGVVARGVAETLVVHGMDGHVWVLRRSDGRLLWHYTRRLAGRVVAGRHRTGIDVFGAWNGTRDRARPAHAPRALAASVRLQDHLLRGLAGSTLYLGDYCGRLLALRAANGALRWSRSVNGRVYGTPAVAARPRLRAELDGRLADRLLDSWRASLVARSTGSYVYSSPAVANGRVFFGSYNGVFYALSAQSGRTLWARRTGGPISGAAVVVDGVAYAGSFAHRIVGVDARERPRRARLPARGVRAGLRRGGAAAAARLLAASSRSRRDEARL